MSSKEAPRTISHKVGKFAREHVASAVLVAGSLAFSAGAIESSLDAESKASPTSAEIQSADDYLRLNSSVHNLRELSNPDSETKEAIEVLESKLDSAQQLSAVDVRRRILEKEELSTETFLRMGTAGIILAIGSIIFVHEHNNANRRKKD